MKVIQEKGLQKKLKGSPGYGDIELREVYIDQDILEESKKLVVIHEVLDIWLHKRVKHSNIDKIAIDIIDALQQLGELK